MVTHAPGSNPPLTEFVLGSPDPNLAAGLRCVRAFSPRLFFLAQIREYSYFLPSSVSMHDNL